MITKEQIVQAATELNEVTYEKEGKEVKLFTGKLKTVAVKEGDLKVKFMEACESIPDDLVEAFLPKSIADIYNAIREEEEAEAVAEAVTEQPTPNKKEKPMKTDTKASPSAAPSKKPDVKPEVAPKAVKPEVAKEEKESRPVMLKRKAEKLSLEKLLEDKELLEKYAGHKAWIRADHKKISTKK
jgi:hypothetical protein